MTRQASIQRSRGLWMISLALMRGIAACELSIRRQCVESQFVCELDANVWNRSSRMIWNRSQGFAPVKAGRAECSARIERKNQVALISARKGRA